MKSKILLCDDSPFIQKVVSIGLADLDVEILIASDFLKTKQQLLTNEFKLIFIDPKLTGSNGFFDFLDLKNKYSKSFFVLLVGSYDDIDLSAFKQNDFKYVLQKPFDTQTLVHLVSELLEIDSLPNNSDIQMDSHYPKLLEDVRAIIKKEVEKFCEKEFKQVAKEVLTQEIRRLADEKTSNL